MFRAGFDFEPAARFVILQICSKRRRRKHNMESKKKNNCALMAGLTLTVCRCRFCTSDICAGQRAKPEVSVQLSAAVSATQHSLPLDKATAVKPGEILEWTSNLRTAATRWHMKLRPSVHIPRGPPCCRHAKADGAKAVYALITAKYYSAQPMIRSEAGRRIRYKASSRAGSMYTEIRYGGPMR